MAALSPPAVLLLLLVALSAAAQERPRPSGSTRAVSATEINKKVTDPVSPTWSLKLQNNVIVLDIDGHGDRVQDTFVFQPTLPFWLADNLKLIPRPKLTLIDTKPYTDDGELRRALGLGDTVLDLVLSPKLGGWLLALGPTFIFPTASAEQTGQGKWQTGPAGVIGYRGDNWLAGVIEQQWWSFAGSSSRSTVSALHLQYIASYFFADGWSIGTSPTIKLDWRASADNRVTFPVGPTLGKVVRLGAVPVKIEIQAVWVPVRPDQNGEKAQIQLNVIPVVPGLIHGLVLGERRER